MARDSELFVERTFYKVVLPTRIKRIGFRLDFYVSPDFGVAGASQFPPNGLANALNPKSGDEKESFCS
jgi:hypothetical protein